MNLRQEKSKLQVLAAKLHRQGLVDIAYKIRGLSNFKGEQVMDPIKQIEGVAARLELRGKHDEAKKALKIVSKLNETSYIRSAKDEDEETGPQFMSSKLKRALGPEMSSVFQKVGENIYDQLRQAFRNSTADVLRSARQTLEAEVQEEYGKHGVKEAGEHISAFYSDLLGSITGDLTDLVAMIVEEKAEAEEPQEEPQEEPAEEEEPQED